MTHTTHVPLRGSDLDDLSRANNTVYPHTLRAGLHRGTRNAHADRLDRRDGAGACRGTPHFPPPNPSPSAPPSFEAPGRMSLETTFRVTVDDELRVEGEAILVWTDVASGESVPVPDALRDAFAAG